MFLGNLSDTSAKTYSLPQSWCNVFVNYRTDASYSATLVFNFLQKLRIIRIVRELFRSKTLKLFKKLYLILRTKSLIYSHNVIHWLKQGATPAECRVEARAAERASLMQ